MSVKRKEWKDIMKKLTTKEFIEKANKIHNNFYNYSKFIYITGHTKSIIICPIHGEFLQIPKVHGEGTECPKCGELNRRKSHTNTLEKFIYKSKIIHGINYDYSLVNYKKTKIKIKIKCNKCKNVFDQTPDDHVNGHGCPICVNHISKPEIEFLNLLNIIDRQIYIDGYRVDGIKNNIIYEFLGDYYHGNPKKFKPYDYNKKCKKTFIELYNNTFKKFKALKEK